VLGSNSSAAQIRSIIDTKYLDLKTIPNQKTPKPNPVMKPYTYSLLAAAIACGMAQGAATAYTTPVGYVSIGDTTPGQPAVKPATDSLLTAPIDRTPVYAGLAASVSNGNEINLQGTPGFTAGQFTATPFVVRVKSGANEGFYALITGNDADTLTVSLPTGQTLSALASGDQISVSPAWTAKSFFGGSTIPVDTELYQYSGVTPGINVASDFLYIWDGVDWIDGVSGSPTDPIIYPGELFVLRNVGAAPITSIVVSGEVPSSGFTNVITNFGAGQQDLPFGVFSPIDQTLAQSGLTAVAAADDELNIYNNGAAGINKAASTQFVFDGSAWLDAVSGDPIPPSFTLKAGDGFIYRRAAGKPTVNWTATPSYVPSL
jgi:uncharacterized protein (TIGR02597 family)